MSRRMARDEDKCSLIKDPLRESVGIPVGSDGQYCVFEEGGVFKNDDTVLDYNTHPKSQPSLWCKWVPSEDGTEIKWNGAEKFYYYVEWIKYINYHFLNPWGIKINGEVKWFGEDPDDLGKIIAKNGVISVSTLEYKEEYQLQPQPKYEYISEAKFKFHGLKMNGIRSKIELLAKMNGLDRITISSSKGWLYEYGWGQVKGDEVKITKFFEDTKKYIDF